MAGRRSTGGFLIGAFPGGTLAPQPEDDDVLAALAERDLAVHVHVGLSLSVPTVAPANRCRPARGATATPARPSR